MSNIFFERNTISNKIDVQPQKEGFSKLRSKRAQSVSEIKLNPAKFQHREVFDAQIYQKVNFFKCGFKELKDYKKPQKNKALQKLDEACQQLSQACKDSNLGNFSKNYSNLLNLLAEGTQKESILKQLTQTVSIFLKKILEKIAQLIKEKQQIQQSFMRSQIDLKLTKKQFYKPQELDSKLTDRREQKEREKKLKEKIMYLDFQLKKETLKSHRLQQQIIEQSKEIEDLINQNKAMTKQKQQQDSYRESMQFKVKRLKEQLQVAHIVKEQNLADKMKYIMNW